MQLTKDDLISSDNNAKDGQEYGEWRTYLDYSKFQQVVEFYERYRDNPAILMKEQPEVIKILLDKEDCIDKLFDYCFKDGLK